MGSQKGMLILSTTKGLPGCKLSNSNPISFTPLHSMPYIIIKSITAMHFSTAHWCGLASQMGIIIFCPLTALDFLNLFSFCNLPPYTTLLFSSPHYYYASFSPLHSASFYSTNTIIISSLHYTTKQRNGIDQNLLIQKFSLSPHLLWLLSHTLFISVLSQLFHHH